MGCDIHLYVEQKFYEQNIKQAQNFSWVSIDKWTKNPYFTMYPEYNEPEWVVELENEIFSERNYFLFAILAGVRNHNNIMPISIPKGLPQDVSKEIRILSDDSGNDAHSHSWLTIKELIDFDWYKTFQKDNELISYKELCKGFTDNFVPTLLKKAESEDIRIVFWFDN